MQLAILGTDSDILQLIAAAQSERHEIVWLGDVRPADATAVFAMAPGLTDRGSEWELLLDRGAADAVLVGRGTSLTDVRADRVKRLTTEGMPLLVVHPAFESVLQYYEVDMIRSESGAPVQHFNPLVGHPVAAELAGWIHRGHPAVGTIHQVSCERQVANAAREEVLDHLARDVELLATMAGDIRRVTAIGPATDGASYASLQIQIKTTTAPTVRWSVSHARVGAVGLDLAFHGERGIVHLRILEGSNVGLPVWKIDTDEDSATNSQTLSNYDPAHAAIRRLSGAIVDSRSPVDRNLNSTWDAATRAMEVVDAAQLSLQKGRTIEVFQQQLTEKLAFRGTMAAIGCGLLLVAFFVLVTIGLLGGFEGDSRRQLGSSWSIILFAVLAFFLLLQAVPFLASKSKRDISQTPATPPDQRKP